MEDLNTLTAVSPYIGPTLKEKILVIIWLGYISEEHDTYREAIRLTYCQRYHQRLDPKKLKVILREYLDTGLLTIYGGPSRTHGYRSKQYYRLSAIGADEARVALGNHSHIFREYGISQPSEIVRGDLKK
jgi:DNA-binding PadR family transcriptional regulator